MVSGTFFHFLSSDAPDKDATLTSLSLVTFTLMKEISVPPVFSLILFEEKP